MTEVPITFYFVKPAHSAAFSVLHDIPLSFEQKKEDFFFQKKIDSEFIQKLLFQGKIELKKY